MSSVVNGILVSDFDGTMTKNDFYDLVCQAFPEILSEGHWQKYEAGEITHFEALRRIFGGIRAPESRLIQITQQMQIEPRLRENVEQLSRNGWKVVVASAGCDWYIRRLLKQMDVDIEVNSNPGEYSGQGLIMRMPEESPFCSHDLGVNKVAVVKHALHTVKRVAFAGDGRPDLAPALLVPPERRFAKSWLAKKLHEIGEDFRPFDRWSEVADALIAEGN